MYLCSMSLFIPSFVLEALGKGLICFEQNKVIFSTKKLRFQETTPLLGKCLCQTDRSISKTFVIKLRNKT